jgi:hypothetical protein
MDGPSKTAGEPVENAPGILLLPRLIIALNGWLSTTGGLLRSFMVKALLERMLRGSGLRARSQAHRSVECFVLSIEPKG